MTNENYSNKQLLTLGAILLAVIALLKLSPLMIYLIAGILGYTLIGNKKEHLFGVIMLLLMLSVMNNALINKDFNFYLVTRGSLFVLAGALSLKSGTIKNAWFLSPFYILIVYMLYMMLASLGGWAPIISELKAVLFLVFLVAFLHLVSVVNLKQVDIGFVRCVMLIICIFYIFGSVAVIPFPSIGQSMIMIKRGLNASEMDSGYLSSISMFNGLTWHSQTLGPLLAVLNAFLLTDYLCSIKKGNWLYRMLLLAIPLLVYKTSSRTAMFAYLISIIASLFFYSKERDVSSSKKQSVLLGFIAIAFIGGIFAVINPILRQGIELFLIKSGDVSQIDSSVSIQESLTKTRMGLVEEGMANFRASPLLGNGFQVSEEMKYLSRSDTGLILSAPIEKGVLPVMVLEEGGVIGMAIFLAFLVTLYIRYSKLRLNCFLATFTTFVALNTGEAVFFSTSGAGGILWSICFCSLIIDVDRHRHSLVQKQMQCFAGGFNAGGF